MRFIEGVLIGLLIILMLGLLIIGYVGGVWMTSDFIQENCETNQMFSVKHTKYKCERA